MSIELTIPERQDSYTSIGSESLVYLAKCDLSGVSSKKTIMATEFTKFPCIIKEVLSMEPKTGEILDDRGRIVYSYSQPSKVKYAGNIFQRDAETFEFLRDAAGEQFCMWVVVGQIGPRNQEILMYGKLGGNYSEDMSAEPNIPIEFNCEVNSVEIEATQPNTNLTTIAEKNSFAKTITIKAGKMIAKEDTKISTTPSGGGG
jgi:hypothetical protein